MRNSIAASYDRWSGSYDEDANATRDLDALQLRASGIPVYGADVLELGCGTGKNSMWLAAQARTLLALDFSDGMLARARARVSAPHVQFVQHDITQRWPADDASVDVVVGNLVLEHVESLTTVFAEARRVLRPGGTLYCGELHPFRQWRGGQAHFTDTESGDVVHVPAFVHTIGEFVNGAAAAGFTLRHLGEWVEEGAAADALPRLLTVQFLRP